MYMDLTVKITNAIPSGGSMTVSLSNVDIKTPQWWLDDD